MSIPKTLRSAVGKNSSFGQLSIILPSYVPNPYYLKFSAISTVFWVTSWVTLIMKRDQTLLKENSIMLFLFRYLICFRILYK